MDFTFVAEGINAVVVDNIYSKEEMDALLVECLSVLPQLQPEEGTSPALDSSGNPMKKNHGAFIADGKSKMVSTMREKILSQEFKDSIINSNSLYRILYACDKVDTLLSYYGNGDYYDAHVDDSIFTAIMYAYKEPKRFSGGEIKLHSYIEGKVVTIEPYNNRLILFPSVTVHSVNPIVLDNDTGGDGRFAISQFIEYESKRK
jgi:Rps23 Pro-64 3,4-dihydroxylase Tpa1-like proline 4-hydroxylase